MKITKIIKSFLRPNLKHSNYIEINKKNILNNLNQIQLLQEKSEIFPVLKSNAYWHWIENISKILKNTDIKYICVDSFPEYQIVKDFTDKKIILLWETIKENYKLFDFSRTSFCVYNPETIKYLKWLNKEIKIHLFLNTWMNREGVAKENLSGIIELLKNSKIDVEWVCSHFSSADEIQTLDSKKQIDVFKSMYSEIENNKIFPRFRHIQASTWILKIKDEFFNSHRPWLLLYGYNPLEKEDKFYNKWEKFKWAFEVYSQIISIQRIKKWEAVSYNKTFKASKNTNIAIIPFWYFEWLSRNLSNNWKFKIDWKFYNQVGNICMNLCAIDIEDKEFSIWEKVQIISNNINDENNIYEMSKKSNKILRETLVWFDSSIHRKIV